MFTPPGYAKVSPQSRRLSIVSARPSLHPCSPCPWHTRKPRFRPAPRPTGSCPMGHSAPPTPHPQLGWWLPSVIFCFHASVCRMSTPCTSDFSVADFRRAEDAIRMGVRPSFRTRTFHALRHQCYFLMSRGFVDSSARLHHCLLSCWDTTLLPSSTHCDPVRGPRSTRMGYGICNDVDAQSQRSLFGFLSPLYRSSLIRRMSLFHFTALL